MRRVYPGMKRLCEVGLGDALFVMHCDSGPGRNNSVESGRMSWRAGDLGISFCRNMDAENPSAEDGSASKCGGYTPKRRHRS